MNLQNVIQSGIAKIVGFVTRESAVAKINRKQADIAAVTESATKTITEAVTKELIVIERVTENAFSRVHSILGTSALTKKQADALAKARAQIDNALTTLNTAF